jgi:hypothetical protein
MRSLSWEVRPRRPLLLHCKHKIDPLLLLLLLLLVVAVVAAASVRQVERVVILRLLLPLARPLDLKRVFCGRWHGCSHTAPVVGNIGPRLLLLLQKWRLPGEGKRGG